MKQINIFSFLLIFGISYQVAFAASDTNELLIKMKNGQALTSTLIFSSMLKSNVIVTSRRLKTDSSINIVKFIDKDSQVKALQELRLNPLIERVEPNFLIHTAEVIDLSNIEIPNDPSFLYQWGLYNTATGPYATQNARPGSDINVLKLWNEGITGSKNVLVAIIDTGLDWTHPDLKKNIYTNSGEAKILSDNNLDDDHNGFIDDIHGWNFINNTNNTNDDSGHGSHVAGIIGASGNDGIGITGVNWNVSLMPLKALDFTGTGAISNAIDALNYARQMKAKIINMSIASNEYSKIFEDAIRAARNEGILVVTAAGNAHTDNDRRPTYPANYNSENILSVAATDQGDELTIFSNYGLSSIHVAAPGYDIYSTSYHGEYAFLKGTSMACPHVTGVAALLLSVNPNMSPSEIKERLILTSDPVRLLKNKIVSEGRINAYNAIHGIIIKHETPNPLEWQKLITSLESPHPYENDQNTRYQINQPGAKFIRLHFAKVGVEEFRDKIMVIGKNKEVIEFLNNSDIPFYSDYIEGDTAWIHLVSDVTTTSFGFKIDYIEAIY